MRQHVGGTRPTGAYSPGVIATGRLLLVSGQGPLRDGAVVSGTVAEQTKLTLENIAGILGEAGLTFDDVVQCRVYLASITDFEEMNAAFAEVFKDPKPARTTIGAGLIDGIKVEIDCIAELG